MEDSDRFSRTRLLMGPEALDLLAGAHVALVGLGGVGSFALEALARAGVGRLTLVDGDTIHASNLNRQLIALESTLGQKKTKAATRRVLDINPDCRIEALDIMVCGRTVCRILDSRPQVIIDATDDIGAKIELITASRQAGSIYVISSMGAATRTDPTAVEVDDISRTSHCPLARRLRKQLKKRGIRRGVTCVFSREIPRKTAVGSNSQHSGTVIPKRPLGSLSCVTGVFGLVAAGRAISHIIHSGHR